MKEAISSFYKIIVYNRLQGLAWYTRSNYITAVAEPIHHLEIKKWYIPTENLWLN